MINKERLELMLKMMQPELKAYLVTILEDMGRTVYNEDGFLYSPGKFPVLICAHMDTVYDKLPEVIYGQKVVDAEIWTSPTGIGGDDRCGIEMILNILEEYDVSIAFLEDEEIGGIGASKFSPFLNESVKEKINYIIEVDRKGYNEAVFYDCQNEEFISFITEDYFHFDYGSFSDISFVAPHNDIAAVNLSAGYYNEHCGPQEMINLSDMQESVNAIKNILKRTDVDKKYEFGHWEECDTCEYLESVEDDNDLENSLELPCGFEW